MVRRIRFSLAIALSMAALSCSRPTLTASEPRGEPTAAASAAGPQARRAAPAGPATPVRSSAAATAPSVAPAAHDLSKDLAARRTAATSELGAGTHHEVVEDVFLVAAPGGRGALAGPIDITRRATAAYFNGRFSKRPERAVSVYLFPEARRYDAYCRKRWDRDCSSPYGFYLSTERKIVMNVGLGIGTLTHELVHPLIETDFPEAPDWLNEGIASLFERFHFPRPGEIAGSKNWRHPRLVAAVTSPAEREIARPSALFQMSDEVFRGEKEDLNYATARYFCQWLDGKKKLWSFYRQWRDGVATDPTGEQAFRHVMGEAPSSFDDEWARWVRAL